MASGYHSGKCRINKTQPSLQNRAAGRCRSRQAQWKKSRQLKQREVGGDRRKRPAWICPEKSCTFGFHSAEEGLTTVVTGGRAQSGKHCPWIYRMVMFKGTWMRVALMPVASGSFLDSSLPSTNTWAGVVGAGVQRSWSWSSVYLKSAHKHT